MNNNKTSVYEGITEEALNRWFPTMSVIKNVMKLADKAKTPIYKPNPYYKPAHDEYKVIAERTNTYLNGDVGDYKYVYSDANRGNGYYAQVYRNDKLKTYVISYKGSDLPSPNDWLRNNANMKLGFQPSQIKDAEDTYLNLRSKLRKENNGYKVVFVGYSLGGSEAQMLGAKYGNETITFNAYGTAHLRNMQINYTDNIVNYGNPNDWVFTDSEHIGNVVNAPLTDQNPLDKDKKIGDYHHLHTLGDLSQMRDDQFVVDYENAINSEGQSVMKSGEVYVHEYTRGDGTDVSSYTRSAPHRN